MQITVDNTLALSIAVVILAVSVLVLAFTVLATERQRARRTAAGGRWRAKDMDVLLRRQDEAMASLRRGGTLDSVVASLVRTETLLHTDMMRTALTSLNISGREPEGIPSGVQWPEGVGQTIAEEVTKKMLGTLNRFVGITPADDEP